MSHDFWSIILVYGIAGWIISTLFFIFSAFPERGRFEARRSLPWGAAIFVHFFLWIAGMLNA
jgi:hypothetical protein